MEFSSEDANGITSADNNHKKLISFSKVLPFTGIPHAGGQYFLYHVESASKFLRMQIFAPAEARNRDALGEPHPSNVGYHLVGSWLHHTCLGRALRTVINRFRRYFPMSAQPELLSSLFFDRKVRNAVKSAQIIELQWAETAGLIPVLRYLNPRAIFIVVAHDVLSQKYQRIRDIERFRIRRISGTLTVWILRVRERRLLSLAHRIIVFSSKDRVLLEKRGVISDITVVHPPLAEKHPRYVRWQPEDRPVVLMTGAFGRPENDEAAKWLLEFVWPVVLGSIPSAHLVLAGSDPSTLLQSRADAYESVEITGYVDSLDYYYMGASCFVAPIFSGAGVKFKVITAMSWNIPVVSTGAGAEGIGSRALYAAVTDEPQAFALAIIEVLSNPGRSQIIGENAFDWVMSEYGQNQFDDQLAMVYNIRSRWTGL